MALSMDEQRMLAEIERRLAAEDPRLAAHLSTFRRPRPVSVFRSARARVIGSLLTVAVVATVSLMAYAIVPFRSGSRTSGSHPAMIASSAGTGQPKLGAGPGAGRSGSSATATAKSAAATPSAAARHTPAAQAAGARNHAGSTGASARPAPATANSPLSRPDSPLSRPPAPARELKLRGP